MHVKIDAHIFQAMKRKARKETLSEGADGGRLLRGDARIVALELSGERFLWLLA